MFKHVELPTNALKEVHPGTQCEDLYFRFLEIEKSYVFDEIIVNVGTNHLRDSSWYDDDIVYEIRNLLEFLVNRTPPKTTVTFAQMLPKRGRHNKFSYIERINYIHNELDSLLEPMGIDIINYSDLGNIIGINIFDIICWDGTHLNRYGVKMVSWYLNQHLGWTSCSYS